MKINIYIYIANYIYIYIYIYKFFEKCTKKTFHSFPEEN